MHLVETMNNNGAFVKPFHIPEGYISDVTWWIVAVKGTIGNVQFEQFDFGFFHPDVFKKDVADYCRAVANNAESAVAINPASSAGQQNIAVAYFHNYKYIV